MTGFIHPVFTGEEMGEKNEEKKCTYHTCVISFHNIQVHLKRKFEISWLQIIQLRMHQRLYHIIKDDIFNGQRSPQSKLVFYKQIL